MALLYERYLGVEWSDCKTGITDSVKEVLNRVRASCKLYKRRRNGEKDADIFCFRNVI